MTHKELKKLIGPSAYRCLAKNGGVLKIWRNSSPHNWWIEGKRGKIHWHSSGYSRPGLKLFEIVENSTNKVIDYWGSDSGKPSLSIYILSFKK